MSAKGNKMSAAERFAEKFIPEPMSGCWIWIGSEAGCGYGRFDGIRANRFALEVAGVKIPKGLVVDHKCRTRLCVNPSHLRIVTQRTNSIENSEGPTAINKAKTHCLRGHEFDHFFIKDGYEVRECLTCKKMLRARFVRKRSEMRRLARDARKAQASRAAKEQS